MYKTINTKIGFLGHIFFKDYCKHKGNILGYCTTKMEISIAREFLLIIATFFKENVLGGKVRKWLTEQRAKNSFFFTKAKIALKNHVVNDGFCQEKS